MKRLFTLCLPLLLCSFSSAFAGMYGVLTGAVTDTSGRPVVGATVRLEGTERGARTRPDGSFTIVKIPPGDYTIKITCIGFVPYSTKVVINADKTTDMKAALVQDASITDTLVVYAKYSELVENDAIGSVRGLEAKQQSRVPAQTVQSVTARQSGVQAGGNGFNIRGGRTTEKQIRIDGLDVNDQFAGGFGRVPNAPVFYDIQVVAREEEPDCEGMEQPFSAQRPVFTPVFISTEQDNLSTFGMDVDNASYTLCRSAVQRGVLPPVDVVRTEEFLNYFDYGYAPPCEDEFAVYMECAPAPFSTKKTHLLKIGIKARELYNDERADAVLTFVIDISGSMSGNLKQVQHAMAELVRTLRPSDMVAIVTFGSSAQVHMEPTAVSQRKVILESIADIRITGSTNVGAGMKLGYDRAEKMFDAAKLNRVILIGDGVANNGLTSSDAILGTVAASAAKGIYLTVVGVGMETYNDRLMEELANRGNGKYYYIDGEDELQRLFVHSQTGILDDVAHDAKIQVEFDPLVVKSYRLLGYENRAIADSLFRNDSTDAGEVGPGHTVTALYELELRPQSEGKVATASIRYHIGHTTQVREIQQNLNTREVLHAYNTSSYSFRLAAVAAQYAELLRQPATSIDITSLRQHAEQVAAMSGGRPDATELRDLIAATSTLLSPPLTERH